MVIGLVLVANLSAAISGLVALAFGADNILLIMLATGHIVPLILVAAFALKWVMAHHSPVPASKDVVTPS